MTTMAYCGLSCEQCPIQAKGTCPGCRASGGKVFWGTCELAVCCIGRGLDHCGRCGEFPCEKLKAYSFHPQHGENGGRIENLRRVLAESRPAGGAKVAAVEGVVIEIGPKDFVLWRCLHGGPLTAESLERPKPHPKTDWPRVRRRNAPLLEKLADTYGGCAVVARDGTSVVASLRFYPKAVLALPGAGKMCMQQDYPNGPRDDFAAGDFPPLEKLADRTLTVYCMATGPCDGRIEGPYRRKGLGTAMARFLIDWARRRGWSAVEANAYEDLPIVYQCTGVAGRGFWEKLGFRVAATSIEPALAEENDFTRKMRAQAAERGVDSGAVANVYTMRLELA